MARNRRPLPQERLVIAREYDKGVRTQALATRYGVSARTINYTVEAVKNAKIENHSKRRTIGVRVTDEEADTFERMLKRHGIGNKGDGLRALIHATNGLFVTDAQLKEDLHDYRVALNRIGNNVSQIAKRMNEANLKGLRPPFNGDDLAQIRALAGMVMTFGDQLQQIIEQRRDGLNVRVSDALKGFVNGQE